MSTRRQKRRGESVDSGQARKRRRLVASSAGGTSEAEPVDPRESAVEEVIDLTDRSSETEVSDLTDDDSVVQQERSQQYPRFLRAADNSAVLLTSDDEEELRDSDGARPASLLRSLSWVDEDSEQWQQRPQYPRFFIAADNSAVLLMSDNEEEQGDYDDIWPAGPASPPFWVDEDSESQQYPRFLRAADNSAVLLTSDDEEELRDSDGARPASLLRSLSWVDEDSEQWQQRPQYPRFFIAADNSAVLLMSDNEEEQGDYDDIWPAGPASPPFWVDEDSEFLEEYEQQRRNDTLRSQRHSDSSVLSSNEEDEATDDDESEDDITCPICMDFYSEILQSERLFLSTVCGHVFCSQCLPAAVETASTCPICRTEVTPEQYHPIFL